MSDSNNPEQLEDLYLVEAGHALNAMIMPMEKLRFPINIKFSQYTNL